MIPSKGRACVSTQGARTSKLIVAWLSQSDPSALGSSGSESASSATFHTIFFACRTKRHAQARVESFIAPLPDECQNLELSFVSWIVTIRWEFHPRVPAPFWDRDRMPWNSPRFWYVPDYLGRRWNWTVTSSHMPPAGSCEGVQRQPLFRPRRRFESSVERSIHWSTSSFIRS